MKSLHSFKPRILPETLGRRVCNCIEKRNFEMPECAKSYVIFPVDNNFVVFCSCGSKNFLIFEKNCASVDIYRCRRRRSLHTEDLKPNENRDVGSFA